jgi:hypothetical protein
MDMIAQALFFSTELRDYLDQHVSREIDREPRPLVPNEVLDETHAGYWLSSD